GQLEDRGIPLPDVEEGDAQALRDETLVRPPRRVRGEAGERHEGEHARAAPRQQEEAGEEAVDERQLDEARDGHVDGSPGRLRERAHKSDARPEHEARRKSAAAAPGATGSTTAPTSP